MKAGSVGDGIIFRMNIPSNDRLVADRGIIIDTDTASIRSSNRWAPKAHIKWVDDGVLQKGLAGSRHLSASITLHSTANHLTMTDTTEQRTCHQLGVDKPYFEDFEVSIKQSA